MLETIATVLVFATIGGLGGMVFGHIVDDRLNKAIINSIKRTKSERRAMIKQWVEQYTNTGICPLCEQDDSVGTVHDLRCAVAREVDKQVKKLGPLNVEPAPVDESRPLPRFAVIQGGKK